MNCSQLANACTVTGGADAAERINYFVIGGLIVDMQQASVQALAELERAHAPSLETASRMRLSRSKIGVI